MERRRERDDRVTEKSTQKTTEEQDTNRENREQDRWELESRYERARATERIKKLAQKSGIKVQPCGASMVGGALIRERPWENVYMLVSI